MLYNAYSVVKVVITPLSPGGSSISQTPLRKKLQGRPPRELTVIIARYGGNGRRHTLSRETPGAGA
jgi:hypothetical protein